jgi:hypothetical protein
LSNFTNYLGTLFTPDSKGNLVWSGGDIDLNTLLKGYFGDTNPAVAILEPILTPFFDSLTKSNRTKAVNDKIELDNLQDTVNSTV